MQNFGDVEKYVTAETNSLGLATDRYKIYLEGVEAAQNRVTASWEKLVQGTVSSGVVADFYNALSGLLDFVDEIGGLPAILTLIGIGLVVVYGNVLTLTGALGVLETVLLAIEALNPAAWIAIIVGATYLWINSIDTLNEKIAKLATEYNDLNASFQKTKTGADRMAELASRLEELRGIYKKSKEEQAEFYRIQEEIRDLLPEVAGHYDELGNFIISTSVSADQLTDSMNALRDAELKVLQEKALENFKIQTDLFKEQTVSLNILSSAYNAITKPLLEFIGILERIIPMPDIISEKLRDLSDKSVVFFTRMLMPTDALEEKLQSYINFFKGADSELLDEKKSNIDETTKTIKESFSSLSEEEQKIQIETLRKMGEWGNKLADEIESLTEKTKGDLETIASDPPIVIKVEVDPEAVKKAMEELVKNVVSMLKQIKELEKDNLQQELKDFKEIIDQRKKEYKDQLDRQKEIYDDERESLKRQQEDERKLFDERKKSLDRQREDEKRIYDERKEALDRQHEDEKRIFDDKKQAIEDELKSYEDIIDAQIELLDKERERDDYNDKRESQQKDLAKLENQILVLSLDNSEEAIAQRLKLEEEAAKLRGEISETEEDREYDLRVQALEDEKKKAEEETALKLKEMEDAQKAADLKYELHLREMEDEKEASDLAYELLLRKMEDEKEASDQAYELRLREMEDEEKNAERRYEIKIKELEDSYNAKEKSLQDQIQLIDEYLSKEGQLNKEAMDLILDKNSQVYEDLIKWNRDYGTGIDDDIIKMWELATTAVEDYIETVKKIDRVGEDIGVGGDDGGGVEWGDSGAGGNPIPPPAPHHSGVNSGFVGNKMVLKSNEEFAKLMKGELVVNPKDMDKFMKNVLPSMADSSVSNTMGGISIDKVLDITVNGSLDKSVIPDIKEIANKVMGEINKVMMSRGFNRRADLFSN